MSSNSISFTATGDSFITAGVPARDEAFTALAALFARAEVRFTNLEVVVREREGFPAAQSGGTWASAPPRVLQDLKDYGFNLINWANNHTLDYSYGGLEATEAWLGHYGFVHGGAGRNLAEAAAVRYLECGDKRVALICATSTFHESWIAGAQRPDMVGRPGVNPLRIQTRYRLPVEELQALRSLVGRCEVNAKRELSVKEGFSSPDPDGVVRVGDCLFEAVDAGGREGVVTEPDGRDMRRILNSISEASRQADYVLVSIHSHEFREGRKDLPAEFLQTFSRQCIDSGAHSIIGHGPHILRGIEIYKQRPIFYSLGNFIFQNEAVAVLPADFYEKFDLGHDANTADALDARSEGDSRGLGKNPKVWHSVVPLWKMQGGCLRSMELHPITLGQTAPRYRRGRPQLTAETIALEEMRDLCAEMGTTVTLHGDYATLQVC